MFGNDDAPGGFERLLSRLPDAFFLRATFFGMLAMTGAFLYVDVRALMEQNAIPWMDPRAPGQLVPLEPATPSDHLRPYLPFSTPVTRDGSRPKLPGLPSDYDEQRLEKKLIFFLGENGKATAIGRIEPGAAEDFQKFLDSHVDDVTSLALHSPGGSVSDALAMGKLIRERNISTEVPNNGYCASSCPLVFASGVKRRAGKHTWIGVHQIYTPPATVGSIHDGMAEAQRISATCQDYLVEMGVDARVWTFAMRTGKRDLYVFTGEQLLELNLATEVEGLDAKKLAAARAKK